jgi:hypothetical protein
MRRGGILSRRTPLYVTAWFGPTQLNRHPMQTGAPLPLVIPTGARWGRSADRQLLAVRYRTFLPA